MLRRVVRSLSALTTHVGKESNRFEEVEAGIEHNPDEVWTEYVDPRCGPWRALELPIPRQILLVILGQPFRIRTLWVPAGWWSCGIRRW